MRAEHWLYIIPLRLRSLFRRHQVECELDEELRYHLDNQVEEYIARGLTPEQARHAALRAFGGIEQHKEECRDVRATGFVDELVQDVRYALRMLRKSPGFAAAAIAMLALGIGATTAILSVVYAVLLKPLPYANPDRLFTVQMDLPQYRRQLPTQPVRVRELIGWPQAYTGVSQFAAVLGANFTLTGSGEPERIGGARVSANFFSVLGVQPRLGRSFVAGEERPGQDGVIVISHEFWSRRFGADPAVLNRSISLDGSPYQIVGILPPNFLFPSGNQLHPLVPLAPRTDVWKPLALSTAELHRRDMAWGYGLIARLHRGIAAEEARQNLERIAQANIREDLPNIPLEVRVRLAPMRDIYAGNIRRSLIIILCAAAVLLLTACVNIAGLMLARAIHRRNEFAMRYALGASRWRLIRQMLTESLVLSVLGAVGGLLLAAAAIPILIARAPAGLWLPQQVDLSIPVLAVTLGIVVITAVGVGLAPAIHVLRGAAPAGSRGASAGPRTERLRRAFTGFEVALSTVLLAVNGLLVHSFVRLMAVDKGFQVERIVCMDLALGEKYATGEQVTAFYRGLLERVRALPNVTAAGATSGVPLTGEPQETSIFLESDTRSMALKRPVAGDSVVSTGYFAAMGIPLRAGRFPAEQETVPAVVIGEKLVRMLWPGEPVERAIGRRIRYGSLGAPLWTVAGIAGDVQTGRLDREALPHIYQPLGQSATWAMSVVVRTASGDPRVLASALREAVRQSDRNVPVVNLRMMSEIVSASEAQRRFQIFLISLFAAAALALAMVGIYGVVSYSVACRTRDIGLRIALGASRRDVLSSVLWKGLRPVGAGLACGLAGAAASAAVLRDQLFGIGPMDPAALGSVVFILLSAAVLACYGPARRAARLDPAATLRCE